MEPMRQHPLPTHPGIKVVARSHEPLLRLAERELKKQKDAMKGAMGIDEPEGYRSGVILSKYSITSNLKSM